MPKTKKKTSTPKTSGPVVDALKAAGPQLVAAFGRRAPRVRPTNQAQPSPNVCIRFTMEERLQVEQAVAASDGAFATFAQFVRSSSVAAAGALLSKKGRK